MKPRDRKKWFDRGLRVVVFVLALGPLTLLVKDTLTDNLGTNPIEMLTHRTGWWTLALLLATLSVTPVRRIIGWGALIKLRRMLGLFAFFYATLHFGIYVGLDQMFGFEYILEDIADRPYITVGFTAFVLLIPLAATSTKKMVKRVGGVRWRRLHRLVYVTAALGVLHFLWLVKADLREPLIFAGFLTVLLGYRVVTWGVRRSRLAGGGRTRLTVPLGTRSTRTESA